MEKVNKYIALKNKHEKVLNNFSQFFAFSEEQLQDGLKKLNTTKENICSTGYGGFIRKSDKEAYLKMFELMNKESEEALKDEEYLYNGFRYELANHEFCITYDYEETLNCLNWVDKLMLGII